MHERIIGKGHSIKFENNYYLSLGKHGKDLYFKPKTRVDIVKLTYISVKNEVCDIGIIELHEKESKEFEYSAKEKPEKIPFFLGSAT